MLDVRLKRQASTDTSEFKYGNRETLLEKGDLGLCYNWDGIIIFSIPSKVFLSIQKQPRNNQTGLREVRFCSHCFATLREIIGLSKECQTYALY